MPLSANGLSGAAALLASLISNAKQNKFDKQAYLMNQQTYERGEAGRPYWGTLAASEGAQAEYNKALAEGRTKQIPSILGFEEATRQDALGSYDYNKFVRNLDKRYLPTERDLSLRGQRAQTSMLETEAENYPELLGIQTAQQRAALLAQVIQAQMGIDAATVYNYVMTNKPELLTSDNPEWVMQLLKADPGFQELLEKEKRRLTGYGSTWDDLLKSQLSLVNGSGTNIQG